MYAFMIFLAKEGNDITSICNLYQMRDGRKVDFLLADAKTCDSIFCVFCTDGTEGSKPLVKLESFIVQSSGESDCI